MSRDKPRVSPVVGLPGSIAVEGANENIADALKATHDVDPLVEGSVGAGL